MKKSQTIMDASHENVPITINLATAGYLLHVLISAAVLILFMLNRGAAAGAVARMNPGMSLAEIEATVNSIQVFVNGDHVFFGVLSFCFAFLIRTGRNWVRVISVVVFVLALLEMLYAWSSPTNVPAILPVSGRPTIMAVQVSMVLILLVCTLLQWLPAVSHIFFAGKQQHTS